jgi:WD40 repeat protein
VERRTGAALLCSQGIRAGWWRDIQRGRFRIVTAAFDDTARIWDAATGAALATLSGHTGWVNSATFSADGAHVVTASFDNTARVWDAKRGWAMVALAGHADRVAAAFSPDGTRVVTASADRTARVWDAATGAVIAVLVGHTDGVNAAVFSSEGSRIVTASADNTARVWNAVTGALDVVLAGHTDRVLGAAFSRDNSRIVTASATTPHGYGTPPQARRWLRCVDIRAQWPLRRSVRTARTSSPHPPTAPRASGNSIRWF